MDLTKFHATNNWIILEDPRPPKNEKSDLIVVPASAVEFRAHKAQQALDKTYHKVLKVGPLVQDKHILPGCHVVVDPRIPGALLAINEDNDEVVAYVQESQVILVITE